MDQKQQLPQASPPRQPQQVVQPNVSQQPTVAPQASSQTPIIQAQQQTQLASNLPSETLQQPSTANNIAQVLIPTNASQPLPEKLLEPADTVDSQAPIKAKQLLQPTQAIAKEQETPETKQSNTVSDESSKQNNEDEPKTDEDPSKEYASWEASEFITHEKPSYWHFAVVGVAIIIAALIYIFTQEIIFSLAAIVLGTVLTIYGSAKPNIVQYKLTGEGVYTDEKLHRYNDFKSFSTIETIGLPYVQLISRKRFMMPLNLHIVSSSIDEITEIIGKHVPYDQKDQDVVDRLFAQMRF